MPNYIDLFDLQLENKKERFIQRLTEGVELKHLREDYKRQFDKYYFPLINLTLENHFESIAIDASGSKREFLNEIYFYINRANGCLNTGESIRELETDVFSMKGPSTMAEPLLVGKSNI